MMEIKLVDNRFVLIDDDKNIHDIDKRINKLIIKKYGSNDKYILDENTNVRYWISVDRDDYTITNNKLAELMGLRIDKDDDNNFIYWNPSRILSEETKELIIDPKADITYKEMLKLDEFTQEVYKDCLVDWRPHEDWNQLIQIMKEHNISTIYHFDILKQYDIVLIRLFDKLR